MRRQQTVISQFSYGKKLFLLFVEGFSVFQKNDISSDKKAYNQL